jgi:hypothetical protein
VTAPLDEAKTEARLSIIRSFAALSPAERKDAATAAAFGEAERLITAYPDCREPLDGGRCGLCTHEADDDWRGDRHFRAAVGERRAAFLRAKGGGL